MLELLDRGGISVRHPESRTLVEREPDVDHVRLVAARAILSDAFDTSADAAAVAAARHRLSTAGELAVEAAARLPVAYQALMIRGGATLLSMELGREAALYVEPARWESPLRRAMALAPGYREPRRLLAVGKLATWFALSDAEREEATRLLRELFAREVSEFQRLSEAWLETASTMEEALAIVPDSPDAWRWLQGLLARRGDWSGAAEARRRWWSVLPGHCRRSLAEADALLEERNDRLARQAYQDVLLATVPDSGLVEVVEHAVARCPAGPVNERVERVLADWVAWGVKLGIGGRQPLAPDVFARVSRLAVLPPPLAATAAVMNGELAEGERLERVARAAVGADWSLYHIARARLLLRRDQVELARAALGKVDASIRSSPSYVALDEQIQVAESGESREPGVPAPAPAGAPASRWPAAAWHLEDAAAWLELEPDAAAQRLAITVVPMVEGQGAVVDIVWDGALVRTVAVARSTLVEMTLSVTASPHLLAVRGVEGARVVPGEVEVHE